MSGEDIKHQTIMKKTIFMMMIALSSVFASCGNAPTEVEPEAEPVEEAAPVQEVQVEELEIIVEEDTVSAE